MSVLFATLIVALLCYLGIKYYLGDMLINRETKKTLHEHGIDTTDYKKMMESVNRRVDEIKKEIKKRDKKLDELEKRYK